MKAHLATSGTGWPPFKVGLHRELHTQLFMSVIPIPFMFLVVTIWTMCWDPCRYLSTFFSLLLMFYRFNNNFFRSTASTKAHGKMNGAYHCEVVIFRRQSTMLCWKPFYIKMKRKHASGVSKMMRRSFVKFCWQSPIRISCHAFNDHQAEMRLTTSPTSWRSIITSQGRPIGMDMPQPLLMVDLWYLVENWPTEVCRMSFGTSMRP